MDGCEVGTIDGSEDRVGKDEGQNTIVGPAEGENDGLPDGLADGVYDGNAEDVGVVDGL